VLVSADNPSSVNEDSALLSGKHLYLAIGNQICKINLERSEKEWSVEADDVSCFGMHHKEDRNEGITGDIPVLELRWENAKWGDEGVVHLEFV